MQTKATYIQQIYIEKLFGENSIRWDLLKDVNILGGINGSGKSTILKFIYYLLKDGFLPGQLMHLAESIYILFDNGCYLEWKKQYVQGEQDKFVVVGVAKDKQVLQFLQISLKEGGNIAFEELKKQISVDFLGTFEQEIITKEVAEKIGDENIRTNLDLAIYHEIGKRNALLANYYEKFKQIDAFTKNNISPELQDLFSKPEALKEAIQRIVHDAESEPLKEKFVEFEKRKNSEADSDLFGEDEVEESERFETFILQMLGRTFRKLRVESKTLLTRMKHQGEDIYQVLNHFFELTHKEAVNTNKFEFKCSNRTINYFQLSGGEKQLLLILLKVFNTADQAGVFLLDEPDLGMHIEWKEIFIKKMHEINPRIQFILSTHAPSMIKGWYKNVKEMGQLCVNE